MGIFNDGNFRNELFNNSRELHSIWSIFAFYIDLMELHSIDGLFRGAGRPNDGLNRVY